MFQVQFSFCKRVGLLFADFHHHCKAVACYPINVYLPFIKIAYKRVLLNALKAEDWEKLDIVFVTKRINQYLNWKIGLKAIERLDKNTKA